LKDGWLQKQMPGGFGPVFSLRAKNAEHARRLPSSLMEWRAMSDASCDKRLLRISCGIEEFDDLKADILQGMESLLRDFP
jgi:cystathionine gamma-synthase